MIAMTDKGEPRRSASRLLHPPAARATAVQAEILWRQNLQSMVVFSLQVAQQLGELGTDEGFPLAGRPAAMFEKRFLRLLKISIRVMRGFLFAVQTKTAERRADAVKFGEPIKARPQLEVAGQ